jgi:23S rRNA (adenine2503-C2)-methyltransferase
VDPYALGRDGLRALLSDQPAYRADQVWSWLARGVDDPERMTDLPRVVRERLGASFDPAPTVLRVSQADDGLTRKVLLGCGDGEAVESVLMLYPRAGSGAARATVCISTQAGCAMGCPFCATGQAGFRRQLGLGEVVRQVTVMQRLLAEGTDLPAAVPDHVTNVVFMGMGEPLANLGPTIDTVRWLTDRDGFGLSARSLTVSTVGLVPGIRRLAALGLPITLAVSLHAPDDALRDDLVPVNRQHPLREVLEACREYLAATGRRLTFEYVLIDRVNSAPEQGRALAELLRGAFPGGPVPHVNLIPYNPTPGVPWQGPSAQARRAFAAELTAAGIPATIRRNRGTAIDAACGQLYADYALNSGRVLPAAVGAADRVTAKRHTPASPSASASAGAGALDPVVEPEGRNDEPSAPLPLLAGPGGTRR